MYEPVAHAYLQHLTADDLGLLAPALPPEQTPARLRHLLGSHPGLLGEALGSQTVFEAVFAGGSERARFLGASPFLVFAVCVHRAATELASMPYVDEWMGPGRRAPVFDVAPLREFVSEPGRRLFLAELLASYTHVASGSVVTFTHRGLRRQRFSELDPVRLAGLLNVVSESERPGIFRRLGDLALFLTGVFPDHTARRGFGPIEEGRLRRSGVLANRAGSGPTPRPVSPTQRDEGAVALLDQLGRRWYRAAVALVPTPRPQNMAVVEELVQRFGHARRILGFVTDRFLFPHRDRWFGLVVE
jgi:hypothetical protein